jgi:antitoxin component of RelBE/YafQ-DinJ toxin-antitoxin module
MSKIAQKPKTADFNVRILPDLKAEAERVYAYYGLTLHAPYTDPEAIKALKEAEQLKKDVNAKSFRTMESLIADLESEDDD